jgi:hypothetical protein
MLEHIHVFFLILLLAKNNARLVFLYFQLLIKQAIDQYGRLQELNELELTSYGDVVTASPVSLSPIFSALDLVLLFLQNGKS